MANKNIVGQKIKAIRKSKKMTQVELSKLTGFKQNTISSHENGSRKLDELDIHVYAEAFKINPAELFEDYNPTVAAHMADDLTDEELLQVQAYIAGLKANRK